MIEPVDFWRMLLLPNAIIISLGLAFIFLLANLTKIKYLPFPLLFLSYLVGETIVVLCLQFESFLMGRFWWPLFPLGAILAILYLILSFFRLKIKIKLPSKFWLFLLFLLMIIFFTLPNIRLAYFNLLQAWDARSVWFFHGKGFYFDNQIDPSFLTNPAYGPEWFHPDYPPAIGLLACFHAHYLGHWHEILNKSFIYFHWLFSLFSLFSLYQAISISPVISLVATIIFQGLFSLNAHWGLADSFWAISFLAGVVLMIRGWLEAEKDDFAGLDYLGAIFPFILAALTKQEGTVAVLLMFLIFPFLIWRGRLAKLWSSFFLMMLSLILFVSPWYIFTFLHGIHSEPKLSLFAFLHFDPKTIFDRIKIIWTLPFKMKLVPWPLFFFLIFCLLASFLNLLFNRKRMKSFFPEIFLFCHFFSYGFILFLIYLSTPHPIDWHLWTSFERTIIPLEMEVITLFVLLARS